MAECKKCGNKIDNPYWGELGFCSRSCYLTYKRIEKAHHPTRS